MKTIYKVYAAIALVILAMILGWRLEVLHDRKKFDREWRAFGANVEAYLPDRLKAEYPGAEDVEIHTVQAQEKVQKSSSNYYFRNTFNITVRMKESADPGSIPDRCSVTDEIYHSARSEIMSICKEFTPFYADKLMWGFEFRDNEYGSDLTEVPLKVFFGGNGYSVTEAFERLSCITDMSTGTTYEFDRKQGRYRDRETVARESWEDYAKQKAKTEKKNSGSSPAGTTSRKGSSGKSSSGSSYSSCDAYDEGYEDVWLDEDYDWDRYWNDDDYASGVDDAMEDEGW